MALQDIYLEMGRRAAEYERRKGEVSAGLAGGLAQIAGNVVQDLAKERIDAPIRKQEAATRELQRQRAEIELGAAKRGEDEDVRLRALFKSVEGGTPPHPSVDEMGAIVGPERATSIARGLAALRPDPRKDFEESHTVLQHVISGMTALPENMREEAYPGVRANLVQRGVIKAEDAPEQYDRSWFDSVAHYGQTPTRQTATPFSVTSQQAEDRLIGGVKSPDEWSQALAMLPADRRAVYPQQYSEALVTSAKRRLAPSASPAGAQTDYAKFLQRWAEDRGIDATDLTSDEELKARQDFTRAGSVRGTSPVPSAKPRGAVKDPKTGRPVKDNPRFPRAIEDWIGTLRNKEGLSRDEAEQKVLVDTWDQLVSDNPNLSMSEAQAAINRLFPADNSRLLAPGTAAPPRAAGASGAPSGRPAPAGAGRTITSARLKEIASQLGISEAEARKRYKALGVEVR